MNNDDIKKLCDEISGRVPAVENTASVVEKVAEVSASQRASGLITEIDGLVERGVASTPEREGKIAIAKVFIAGDILAKETR